MDTLKLTHKDFDQNGYYSLEYDGSIEIDASVSWAYFKGGIIAEGSITSKGGSIYAKGSIYADGSIIAEAFNVLHETGYTPRELAGRLRAIHEGLTHCESTNELRDTAAMCIVQSAFQPSVTNKQPRP